MDNIYKVSIIILLLIIGTIIFLCGPYNEYFTDDSDKIINERFPRNPFRIVDRKTGKCISINENNVMLKDIDNTDNTQVWRRDDSDRLISSFNNNALSLTGKVKYNGIPLITSIPNVEKLQKWKINKLGHITNMQNNGYLSYNMNTYILCIHHSIPDKWYIQLVDKEEEDDKDITSNGCNSCTESNICNTHKNKKVKLINIESVDGNNDDTYLELLKCKSEFKIPKKSSNESIENFTVDDDNNEYDIKNHKDYKRLMENLMKKEDCSLRRTDSINNHPEFLKYMSIYAVRDESVPWPPKFIPINNYKQYILGLISQRDAKYRDHIHLLENIIKKEALNIKNLNDKLSNTINIQGQNVSSGPTIPQLSNNLTTSPKILDMSNTCKSHFV